MRRFLLFICVINIFSCYAQSFNTFLPKNNQYVSNIVNFSWNIKSDSLKKFQICIRDDNASLIIDSIINKNNFNAEIPNGDYNWVVFLIENGSKSDSTEVNYFKVFSPSEIDSLHLWLNGDSIELSSTNKVEKWFDLSDSAFVLSQSSSSNQPTYTEGALNGYSALSFTTPQNFNSSSVFIDKKDFYITGVYSHDGAINKQSRLIFGSSNWFLGSFNGSHLVFDGVNILNAGPTTLNKFVVHSAHSVKDTISSYLNGNFKVSRKAGPSPQNIKISRISGDYFEGKALEIIMYNGAISKSNSQDIDKYLMDKYAPPVNLGADRTVCSFPDSMNLDIDYALDFQWSTGDTTSKTVIDSAGKYYLTITDMFDRISADSVWFILDTSDFQVDLGFEDSTICLGDSLVLIGGPDRFSYSWNTLDSSNSIVVKNKGTYSVNLKNCRDNISSDSVNIIINNPVFSLGGDTVSCFNELLQLNPDSTFTNANYYWSTGETSSSIIADTSDFYTLLVIDDFGCSYSDSIDVQIDSSLFGTTLGADTSLCEGNFIGLIEPDSSIISYLWSTGNVNTVQQIDTAGQYKVMVSSIRCSVSDSINITIQGFAPQASFVAEGFCFEDTVKFNDSSNAVVGDTIKSWYWDFDDLTNSSLKNPTHNFQNVQSYRVLLEVTTNKNCSDTISHIIEMQPKPEANFGISNTVSCSKNRIFFVDSTDISSGFIADYLWRFNDSLIATDTSVIREPSYIFDTLGTYNVSLMVRSDQGCMDTIVKAEFVNPTPIVGYSFSGSCLNDSTFFINQTILPQGNFESFLWATNGQVSLRENPTFKYFSSGLQNVSLRVITEAGCESTLRNQVEIFENPIADFLVPIGCLGDSLEVSDVSTSVDSIVKYRYVFNEMDTSYLQNPSFETSETGNFELKLNVGSVNGCEDSISKQIMVVPKPQAAFDILNNGSGVPFQMALNNTSKNANQYLWDFGNGDSSSARVPSYIYNDTGVFIVKLIAINSSNCKDSVSKQAIAISSFLDALLDKVILSENSNGELIVSAQIINTGSNTIESIKLSADLNNQYQIIETFGRTLFKGNSSTFTFSGTFNKEAGEKLDFVCVKIEKVNNVVDQLLTNNQLCEKGFNERVVLNVYPNPASESLIMDYVLPLDGELNIKVYDQLGRMVLDEFKSKVQEGFYQTKLNVINLRAGLYYYSFSINGDEINGSFVKR